MLTAIVMILVIATAVSFAGALISLLTVGVATMCGSKKTSSTAKRVAKILFIIFTILFIISLIVHFLPAILS